MANQMSPSMTPKRNSSEAASSLSDEQQSEEWRTRSHLALVIDRIPVNWMVADLKSFLDGFGNVVKLEIFEDREVYPNFIGFLISL